MTTLLHLLNLWIECGAPPDVLSYEWIEDGDSELHTVCFLWETTEQEQHYPFDASQYALVWHRFQEYWSGRSDRGRI